MRQFYIKYNTFKTQKRLQFVVVNEIFFPFITKITLFSAN